ncbi:MAG TPA: hypothetical protein VGG64_28975 [Pirellulales bacterium]|jgi:hypothetical protein
MAWTDKPASFYIPVMYDPKMFPKSQRDYAHYFLNLLHWKWISWQADNRGYIRLKYDYLTKVIPVSVYKTLRNALIDSGVVQCDKQAQQGHKSYGFRLAPGYRHTRRVRCRDESVDHAIRVAYGTATVSLLPVHEWLKRRLAVLTFDMPLAESIVATMVPDEGSTLTVGAYRLQLLETCQKFVDGELPLTCDRFGRVHTPITSLAKQLRPCLRVDGEPLVSLDLANSQPLIAGICARQFFRAGKSKQRLLLRTFEDGRDPYRYADQQPATKADRHPDVEEYIELCERGRFYESLMERGEDRNRFKTRFYAEVFFGKPSWRSKLRNRFEDRYPSVAAMLEELKRTDYRRSAWILQNYEATIFIRGICNKIRAKRPKLALYTVHDSFLMKRADVGLVRRMILAEFNRYGVRPNLSLESYRDPTTAVA